MWLLGELHSFYSEKTDHISIWKTVQIRVGMSLKDTDDAVFKKNFFLKWCDLEFSLDLYN